MGARVLLLLGMHFFPFLGMHDSGQLYHLSKEEKNPLWPPFPLHFIRVVLGPIPIFFANSPALLPFPILTVPKIGAAFRSLQLPTAAFERRTRRRRLSSSFCSSQALLRGLEFDTKLKLEIAWFYNRNFHVLEIKVHFLEISFSRSLSNLLPMFCSSSPCDPRGHKHKNRSRMRKKECVGCEWKEEQHNIPPTPKRRRG